MIIGFGELCLNIRRPNPPVLSKTPANIIDPAVDASTCALGSHMWNRSIGVFIRNAKDKDSSTMWSIMFKGIMAWIEYISRWSKIILVNKSGSDPVIV